ncbi:hypothetical protein EV645_3119 [Kribbella rubisoli]|uniref:DUF222 domain-containing protein n=1 Tax=Kribbella rubisoli TaxID=3075929 RepID=A0A4Q7WYC5_9ACTN|nr:hypothetical protein [Kribbella rubisoli]RZU15581.1 hypothetical protein EV645_3119 [Kribbella rubisoli]
MFDTDLSELSTADLLESAAEHRAIANQADARLLQHAQIYADRFHPSTCGTRPGRRTADGRERAVVLGGDGCPQIAEFAIAEFGVILGISPMVARQFLGEALALRHRFPFTWARVQAGDATPWKARQLATLCLKLSEEAARSVDQRVAALIDSITPYRLDKIIRAAKTHADPEQARDETAEAASERGVFVGRSDHHGNKTIYAKAPAGAVIRFDAKIAAIAEALKTFGDTRHLQHRRADALRIIADPRFTQELLTQARTSSLASSPGRPSAKESSEAAPGPHPAAPDPQTAAATRSATADPQASVGERSAAAGRGAFGPLDCTRDAPGTSADPAHADTAASPASPPHNGPRNRTNDTPCASADPARDATAAFLASPAYGRADRGDAYLADPAAEPVELRDPPLADGAGPCDPDPPSDPFDNRPIEYIPGPRSEPDDGVPLDTAAQRALDARLAQIKHDAYTNPASPSGGQVRPGQTEIFVHLTDLTLATGNGVLRAEGIGPLLADQLTELVGHGPYTVKPVIDLNDAVSADAYEIPTRIRERVRLTHPVELFPYGTRETHRTIDLDHIQPYDPYGATGQTSTRNLAPLSRFAHRVKTHARGWNVRRVDAKALEWTTPHGFRFEVGPTGTHRLKTSTPDS